MSLILAACLKTYPDRPALNAAEWPYTREELEDRIDYWMLRVVAITALGSAPEVWFGCRGRQLIHNGRKP